MIERYSFNNRLEEQVWLAESIVEKINDGTSPADIAIIARKHETLQLLAPILLEFKIPISYERSENVLEKNEILQIVDIIRFCLSLNQIDEPENQELFSQILQFPFWRLDSLAIYKLSLNSYRNRKTWLENMLESPDENLQNLAKYFLELSICCKNDTAESILDKITGVSSQALSQNEDEDLENNTEPSISYNPDRGTVNIKQFNDTINSQRKQFEFISPFKWYYFDSLSQDKPVEYFHFLSNLKTFFKAVREYKSGKNIYAKDVLEYVDLMKSSKNNLLDYTKYNTASGAVSLLTAHKSKGLEFESVYIISCVKDEWNGKGISNKIGLPTNLPLLPESENVDDALRLFFVAITRAKKSLVLTSYLNSEKNKQVEELSFLVGLDKYFHKVEIKNSKNLHDLDIWTKATFTPYKISNAERAFLEPELENYQLSVTHLNNFLDLSQGGPSRFFEQNLLRFPQAKSPSGSFGSSMHQAIATFYKKFSQEKLLPDKQLLLDYFKFSLTQERLSKKNYDKYLKKGIWALSVYYDERKNFFDYNDKIEIDFKSENVTIDKAVITGKIDKILVLEPNLYQVADFKTGKPSKAWSASEEDEKTKLDRYKRQLLFYKLLVENSRTFSTESRVETGVLEFLEPDKNGLITILNLSIDTLEVENLKKLINVVWTKIQNLDFSLAKDYTQDFAGSQEFILDLINS